MMAKACLAPNATCAAAERRSQIETWLAQFLWHYGDAGVIEGDAAKAILEILETCLPISEQTRSCPLPNPAELIRVLESRSE